MGKRNSPTNRILNAHWCSLSLEFRSREYKHAVNRQPVGKFAFSSHVNSIHCLSSKSDRMRRSPPHFLDLHNWRGHIDALYLSHIIGNRRWILYTSLSAAVRKRGNPPKFQSVYLSFSARFAESHQKIICVSDSPLNVNRLDSRISRLRSNCFVLP